MSRNVRRINIEAKGLANKITWEDYDYVPPEGQFTGTLDISKATLNGDLTIWTSNFDLDSASENYIMDYHIDMREGYKYSFKISQPADVSWNIVSSVYSYYEKPKNVKVVYNFSTNSFNITWNPVDSSNILTESTVSYDIWIYYKNNNNLVKFNSSTTNKTITNGDQDVDGTQLNIVQGTYFFYITPKFSTQFPDWDGPIVKGYNDSYLKSGNNVVAPANFIIKISPEIPKQFKITSSYDGKISFSWKHNEITPDKYRLTLTGNSSNTYDINGNTNTFVLDNTDLANNGLKPGVYSISLKAIYNSNIESNLTDSLSFTIPVTNINFTYKLVDAYGIETNNIRNGVEGIIINWNKLSYATYYKISISEIDQNGTLQNTLVYSEPGNKDSISLKWNFQNSKSKFIIQMSYTSDDFGDGAPTNSEDALGENYLGVEGVDYDKLFVPLGSGGGLGIGGGIFANVPLGEGFG